MSSESEAGKIWLVLAACEYELRAGHAAVYVDFGDDERSAPSVCRPL